MLDNKNIVALGKAVLKADRNAPVAYSYEGKNLSYEALHETLHDEFVELAGTYQLYRRNKSTIFEIMEEVIEDILPKRVEERYEQFAETKQFAQGDKPLFRHKLNSRARAKQFITRVGHAGVYEVFKLGKTEEVFEVKTSAIGGAAQIGFEEFLDGRVDFAEVIDIILEGIDDLIYKEVGAALKASVNQLPPANRASVAGWDEATMDKLIMIASAYGTPTIYCTLEFATRMVPKEAWRWTEAMKGELWENGRLTDYKGTKVIILEQGFEDESNSTKVIDPGYAWVIPSGANSKPVKIALEGGTIMDEYTNYDRSRELQVYKKVGVVCMFANNICAYVDTSLAGNMTTWNLNGVAGNVLTYDGRLDGTVPTTDEDEE